MAIKRLFAVIITICVMCSIGSVTALAKDNNDTRQYFYFSDANGRVQLSKYREKEDTSPLYFRTESGTLPYKGYCISAYSYHEPESTQIGARKSSSTYLINDYREYLLRCDLQTVGAGHFVALQGRYPFTTYDWGDVTIWWSPDSVDTGGLVTLHPNNVTPVDPSKLS